MKDTSKNGKPTRRGNAETSGGEKVDTGANRDMSAKT